MPINSRRIFSLIVTLPFAISALACLGQDKGPSFKVLMALPDATVKTDSPIRLNMTVENETNQVLFIGSIRFGARESGIIVRDREGKKLPYKYDPAPDSIHKVSGAGLGVGPGKTAAESVNLNRYFNFRAPGKYSVQVILMDPLTHMQVASNSATLTVTP